ncbi:MAG: formate dehydrogenase accessory sulfurtransferase FdhD [Armatimonadota bacterium]|nr:formate dehydrogenase accessory sulfurtransferase FdhD [Armatimonadota bacterium]
MHTKVKMTRWEGARSSTNEDTVVVEEPLEIRINGESFSVTMRTPGDDFALTAGFLLAEGVIRSAEEINSMAYCQDPQAAALQNIVNVYLPEDWQGEGEPGRWDRRFAATSSCGLCGKTSLEGVLKKVEPLPASSFRVRAEVVTCLSSRMREAQKVFAMTGGLHAAALFDGVGRLIALREDIGRHNAVDKLIGAEALACRMPLEERVMMVSGRTSFEIMQKVAVARVPILCAVSAPSSLAIELAEELNITLIGFLRGETMNVYSGEERIE